MTFVGNESYVVVKTDGTTITFKFVGGEPPQGEVNGIRIPLTEIFSGGFISVTAV